MSEVDAAQLKQAVEALHGCRAILDHAEEVHETFQGQPVWDGIVHVFKLSGHPDANIAYARSSSVEGSDRRKFYAVLHKPPVGSAIEAVRVAIMSDNQHK